jgi:hypothetical protein
MKTNLLSLFVLVSVGSFAHADTASMGGVFQLGAACPGLSGSYELVRVHQNPDGTTSTDSSEFVVPSGLLLEITDIEFQPWVVPSWFDSSVTLYVQNRSSQRGYVAAAWNSGPGYLGTASTSDGSITTATTVIVSPHTTEVFHLNSGVLVGPAARVCVSVPQRGTLPGMLTGTLVRGKLISDGVTTVITPPPPPVGTGTAAM